MKSSARQDNPLSKERIIEEAIAILDDAGEHSLTFRTLADRLSTGAGALYHYVDSKEALLSAATGKVIETSLTEQKTYHDAAFAIKETARTLWTAAEAHPWIGVRLLVDPTRTSIARIYEAVGSKLEVLGVPATEQFDVASAICNYILGNVTQQSSNARLSVALAQQGYDRKKYLEEMTKPWKELDKDEYPFMHSIIAQFPEHDDFKQYLSGIDLLLAGIEKNYS